MEGKTGRERSCLGTEIRHCIRAMCERRKIPINYELQKPIETELYELFRPFGYLNYELGNERLGEVYILGKNGVPQ